MQQLNFTKRLTIYKQFTISFLEQIELFLSNRKENRPKYSFQILSIYSLHYAFTDWIRWAIGGRSEKNQTFPVYDGKDA